MVFANRVVVEPASLPLAWLSRAQRPLARLGILISCLGLVSAGLAIQAGHGLAQATPAAVATIPQPASSFPGPGRYLFGQVPTPNQIGQGYMVLESTGNLIYGAVYFPSSSFDCFQGQVQGNQLAMTIVDSYTQESYPYHVALVTDAAIATTNLPQGLSPVNLSGFHPIHELSDNDLIMLGVCRPR